MKDRIFEKTLGGNTVRLIFSENSQELKRKIKSRGFVRVGELLKLSQGDMRDQLKFYGKSKEWEEVL